MHTVQCNDCQGWFSRKDFLKRHQRSVHGKAGIPSPTAMAEAFTPPPPPQEFTPPSPPPQEFTSPQEFSPPPPPKELTPPPLQEVTPTSPTQPSVTVPSQQRQEGFVFKHPFTANISGPTCCGKTYFCKMLLQHCLKMIWPPPEKILWLYKRWQPLYDVIQSTEYPKVEFIQGIPLVLDQDSFINPKTRNLVILDDLMCTASKDSRINELFMEGSHHRNLSVIAIKQNLYYHKDHTQRRNYHYMVLFNNPVDKQQIMILSRQMYPENPQHLLRHFKEATSKPYGYLLIDLKPTTPEHLRMCTNIMNTIKPKSTERLGHFRDSRPNT